MTEAPRKAGLIARIGTIGELPGEDDDARLRRQFLVYMGVLMSGGGVMWGTIAAAYRLMLPATIPYGYIVITALNLLVLAWTKDFARARFVQVVASLLLPFMFQWSLGGFVESGAVMLWAMLSLVGSMTFSDRGLSVRWFVLYATFTIVSGLVDGYVRARYSIHVGPDVQVAFFVANIVVISGIVTGLTLYILTRRELAQHALQKANDEITALNSSLEEQVAARTRELRSALAERQAILESLVDGLVAVDEHGVVRVANPALAKMFRLDRDPVSRGAGDVLPEDLVATLDDAAKTGAVKARELALDGARTGKLVASPITTEDGVGHGVVALVRDVTLEKEIDRMKTDFIATVSHELRTPLTSVLGFAKITRNKLEERVFSHVPPADKKSVKAVEQARGNMDIIVREGERLTQLINDVLDISKMEAGRMEWKMEPLEVPALIERAVSACASLFAENHVELRTDVAAGLPRLTGDFDRLLQVVINLVSNAAKFTDEGSVTVGARRVDAGVEISVKDTGGGIDPALHASIFEKFKQVGDTMTNKPKGTGLGLPICRQIVQAHGGEIGVESALGRGAKFAFVLPVSSDAAAVDAMKPSPTQRRAMSGRPPAPSAAQGQDILVVDDDASVRELLRQELTEMGYKVRLASNGYEAINEVRARRPNLVILDIMMPELSGFDVAAVLKNDPKTEELPILMLSIVQDTERGLRLGVDRHMTKPADAAHLAETVRELIEQRSGRAILVVDPESKRGAGPEA